MFCQRLALVAGVLLAAASSVARAEDCATPCTRTVCMTEWVPEKIPCTRTVYRSECRQESYTAYRCECVPETCTRTCTVYKPVAETRTVTRTVCECVPTVEERTVMKMHVTCKPVTKMVRRCVDRGHWECREVPCKPTVWEKLKNCCKKDDCCEPCCPKTKVVKVWVPCKVWEEVPVTCMQRVCECKPVTCKVTVYKKVMREEACQVTSWKCVPEQRTETFQVMKMTKVPYQATRTVTVCVPHQETVMETRLVARTVHKQVPVDCCSTSCCKPKCACR